VSRHWNRGHPEGVHLALCALTCFVLSRGGQLRAAGVGSVIKCAMEVVRDGNDRAVSGAITAGGSRGGAEVFGRRRPSGGPGGGGAIYDDRGPRPGGWRCGQPGGVRAGVGGKRPGAAALSALRLRGTFAQCPGFPSTGRLLPRAARGDVRRAAAQAGRGPAPTEREEPATTAPKSLPQQKLQSISRCESVFFFVAFDRKSCGPGIRSADRPHRVETTARSRPDWACYRW